MACTVLSIIATIYAPLSFMSSVFGMNVSELIPGSPVTIWIFVVVALSLSALTFLVAGWWDTIKAGLASFKV